MILFRNFSFNNQKLLSVPNRCVSGHRTDAPFLRTLDPAIKSLSVISQVFFLKIYTHSLPKIQNKTLVSICSFRRYDAFNMTFLH